MGKYLKTSGAMLLSFTVGNFRSFKENKTFSMVAAPAPISEMKEIVRNECNKDVLPVVAIYGANSSGKSNLLLAMRTMCKVLRFSIRTNPSEELDTDVFKLDEAFAGKPTHFEVICTIESRIYRYGFEYNAAKVVREWLFDATKDEEKLLFVRNENGIGCDAKFAEGKDKEEMTADNRLFLSLVAQLNGEISRSIMNWFQNFIVVSAVNDDDFKRFSIDYISQNSQEANVAKDFLNELDLGFSDLKKTEISIEDRHPRLREWLRGMHVENSPKIPFLDSKISFLESGHDVRMSNGSTQVRFFPVDEMESAGTKKMLNISGPIADTLAKGRTLVIDELDAKLHPLLTRKIIAQFNSRKSNSKNAQLIFATHDTNLLGNKMLRRDQIWFAEKDRDDMSTDIYPLSEIKEQNGDVIQERRVYEKDYINGKYGAIPFIRNWDEETIAR